MNAAEREGTLVLAERPAAMSRNRGLRLASMAGGGPGGLGVGGFDVSVISSPRRTVVRPMGELDLSTSGILETAVVDALHAGAPEVVLDLRRLEFCDAAGLHVFLRVRRLAAGRGARLWLERPTGTVRRVLEVCDLDWLLAERPRH